MTTWGRMTQKTRNNTGHLWTMQWKGNHQLLTKPALASGNQETVDFIFDDHGKEVYRNLHPFAGQLNDLMEVQTAIDSTGLMLGRTEKRGSGLSSRLVQHLITLFDNGERGLIQNETYDGDSVTYNYELDDQLTTVRHDNSATSPTIHMTTSAASTALVRAIPPTARSTGSAVDSGCSIFTEVA